MERRAYRAVQDEPATCRFAPAGERLWALLRGAAQEHGSDPTSTGRAPWHQRAGRWAVGTWQAFSNRRASQALACPWYPAPGFSLRSGARGSATPLADCQAAAEGLQCLLDAGAARLRLGSIYSPCPPGT